MRMVVTPLLDYAFMPTKSNTCNIGLELYSPYVYEIEPFRTIQICMDLLIKLPTGVTRKILARGEGSLFHVVADSIPSNFEKVVEISVKNPIDKKVSIPRGCKIARIIPQMYYQPEIFLKPLQPKMPTTPDVHVVTPPPYGHQQVLRTSSTDGQMQGCTQQYHRVSNSQQTYLWQLKSRIKDASRVANGHCPRCQAPSR